MDLEIDAPEVYFGGTMRPGVQCSNALHMSSLLAQLKSLVTAVKWLSDSCLQANSNPQLSAASPSVLDNPGLAIQQQTSNTGT